MTDLHVHLLPGLDDGPADMAAALALLRALVAEGVRAAVATPHVVRGLYEPAPADVLAGLGTLAAAARAAGLVVVPAGGAPGAAAGEAAAAGEGRACAAGDAGALLLAAAAEYRLEPDLPQYLARTGALTIGGRFLLLEWPFESVPGYTDRVIFELQLAGYAPVLAHPERNTAVQRRPELVLRLVERGVLVQITAASFLGLFGRRARGAAEGLLRAGAVHVVASDAHDARERPPHLVACYRQLARLAGEETARALLVANPARLMRGQAL